MSNGIGNYSQLKPNDQRFLQEVARSVYASGKTDDITASKGYVGMLNGRVVNFEAGKLDRTFGRVADSRYRSSSNLAQELQRIASQLNVECPELAAFTSGGKKLLERSVVARALTQIGGKELWEKGGFNEPVKVFLNQALKEAKESLAFRFNTFGLPHAKAALDDFGKELLNDKDRLKTLEKFSGPELLQACSKLVEEEVSRLAEGSLAREAEETSDWLAQLLRSKELSSGKSESKEEAAKPSGENKKEEVAKVPAENKTGEAAKVPAAPKVEEPVAKEKCFEAVFRTLLTDDVKTLDQLKAKYPCAGERFEEEWKKAWKEGADPKQVTKDVQLACGNDIVTLDRFVGLFDKAKEKLKRDDISKEIVEGDKFTKLGDTYTEEECNEIKRGVNKVLDGFFDAKTVNDLPPCLRTLRSAEDEEMFKKMLIDAARGSVEALLTAHTSKNGCVERRVETVTIDKKCENWKEMKATLTNAISEKKGLKQHGSNTCFIKSVVNSLIGTKKGCDILGNLIDEDGNYTFNAFDPVKGKIKKITVSAQDRENAKTSGKFKGVDCTDACKGMDDLELAVWLALQNANAGDKDFKERPGEMGEANAVANLFGFKADEGGTDGDLGQWADTVGNLNKDGIAVYRIAFADGKGEESGYRHFVAVTGTTNDVQFKTKGYQLVDSSETLTHQVIALNSPREGAQVTDYKQTGVIQRYVYAGDAEVMADNEAK